MITTDCLLQSLLYNVIFVLKYYIGSELSTCLENCIPDDDLELPGQQLGCTLTCDEGEVLMNANSPNCFCASLPNTTCPVNKGWNDTRSRNVYVRRHVESATDRMNLLVNAKAFLFR